jgi:hypothetical protein
MMKAGVKQFGFAPVFYIPQFEEIPNDTFITGLHRELEKRIENIPKFSL